MEVDEKILDILESAHRNRCGSERLFCYTPTNIDHSTTVFRLSIVEEDEPGHFPVTEDVACGTYDEMTSLANRLNHERLKLTHDRAVMVVASSMTGNVERHRR